jgi:hypothetical protein
MKPGMAPAMVALAAAGVCAVAVGGIAATVTGSASAPGTGQPPAASAADAVRLDPTYATADDRWPGPDSTGVPDDVTLVRSGPVTISTPDAVVEGLEIHGDLTILADNVTVRHVRVVGGVVRVGDETVSPGGVILMDSEVDGRGRSDAPRLAGIGYSGITVLRADIHHVGVGVAAVADVVVRDSWIHDLVVEGDPADGGSHNEPILSNGGRNLRFIGNRLEAGPEPNMSAALALYGDFEPIIDVEVTGNLLAGGGYALYAGSLPDKRFPRAERVRVMNNVFFRDPLLDGGTEGPVAGWGDGPGHVWSGNVWSDDGSPVTP